MANEEHLAKLREGREAWNEWMEGNVEVTPDLIFADLRNQNLAGYEFIGAALDRADLTDTTLVGARFLFADLTDVTLTGADLTEAVFGYTTFAHASLENVRGLEKCIHQGPSSIGIDTLLLSPNLPEAFLRGCGVPDSFITYAASLTAKPIEYYSCFLSYSTKDDAFARRLYADLQAKNIRTWFAPEDLKIGDPLKPTIDQSIRLHEKLLLVVSENSIRSAWAEREVEAAMRQEQKQQRTVLFPVRLDDGIFALDDGWATDLRQRHIGDFREWKSHDSYARAFDRLVRDLKKSP